VADVAADPLLPLRAGFASEAGGRRANEDGAYANVQEGIFLVADGVGGSQGGVLASQLLVDFVPQYLVGALAENRDDGEAIPELIKQAIDVGQAKMSRMASSDPSVAQMGSTIVLAVIANGFLYLTHLGDSRAYLVRQGTIRQLTKDHTLVQTFLDAGTISAREAELHPFRHVILDCVSAAHPSFVEVASHQLQVGDRLLLTTDGVTNVVKEKQLARIVTGCSDAQEAARQVVQQALDRGTRDNATCLAVHIGQVCPNVERNQP
jgi:protein phosphatase